MFCSYSLYVKHLLISNALMSQKIKTKYKKSSSIPLDKICRLCCKSKGDIPIFENKLINIPQVLRIFFEITIDYIEHCSNNICRSCFNLLKTCMKLKNSYRRNLMLFRNFSKKKGKSTLRKVETLCDKKLISISDNTICNDWENEMLEDEMFDKALNNSSTIANPNMYPNKRDPQSNKSKNISQIKTEATTKCTKKRNILCHLCGFVTFSNGHLLLHMAKHENIFPFQCDECAYKGKSKYGLSIHKRTHLTVKPFQCSHCPKTTSTSSNLKRHIANSHTDLKPYKCDYCDKIYFGIYKIKRHINTIHMGKETANCHICSKEFQTRKALRSHLVGVHKVKKFQGKRADYLKVQMQNQEQESMNSPHGS